MYIPSEIISGLIGSLLTIGILYGIGIHTRRKNRKTKEE